MKRAVEINHRGQEFLIYDNLALSEHEVSMWAPQLLFSQSEIPAILEWNKDNVSSVHV